MGGGRDDLPVLTAASISLLLMFGCLLLFESLLSAWNLLRVATPLHSVGAFLTPRGPLLSESG